MAKIDNEGLSPLGVCCLWGINKYTQESACDCEHEMAVTDKGLLLVPVDRPHWIFRGRIGSKNVRPICGDLRYFLDIFNQTYQIFFYHV